jgi:hypothetical protein
MMLRPYTDTYFFRNLQTQAPLSSNKDGEQAADRHSWRYRSRLPPTRG